MVSTKIKGIINENGELIINEKINLNPGEVDIIILQTNTEIKYNSVQFRSQTFKDLLETESPLDEAIDIDIDAVKWNYLQEKYNL